MVLGMTASFGCWWVTVFSDVSLTCRRWGYLGEKERVGNLQHDQRFGGRCYGIERCH
jgi:hypothetical protein